MAEFSEANLADMPAQLAGKLLRAKARGAQPRDTEEEYHDDETRASRAQAGVARRGYGQLPVYVLTPNGVVRRMINEQSIVEVLNDPKNSATCQDCGSETCSGEMNGCPGRPPRKFAVCPERSCQKRIYDSRPTGKFLVDEFDHSDRNDSGDTNLISFDEEDESTPESRIRARRNLHIRAYHNELAEQMGLKQELPQMAVR